MQTIRLASAKELDIVKTFECGQCFRWNADEKGVYTGVVRGYPARVWTDGGEVFLCSDGPDELWRDYFDLSRDYARISRFDGGEYLDRCVQYGMGIRILRQEPWEALCSFIISQCNNIKRIKGIVERLCESLGDELRFDGQRFYSFPGPEKLAFLLPEDLSCLRCGYRGAYLIDAARSVCTGHTELQSLISASADDARKALLKINGVGEKVANCVVLFGLHHMEAFPIDVWIKRALKEHFPKDFDPSVLGEYAGLAQQYIFYYARIGVGEKSG
ncbi:MAG: DNA-3-methyladenine glycosylase 2 family protein [Clostridiales bacterium]|nr:DNA-3-methyladenine glycosylase 2 family protein [Clostridiales bacterium]